MAILGDVLKILRFLFGLFRTNSFNELCIRILFGKKELFCLDFIHQSGLQDVVWQSFSWVYYRVFVFTGFGLSVVTVSYNLLSIRNQMSERTIILTRTLPDLLMFGVLFTDNFLCDVTVCVLPPSVNWGYTQITQTQICKNTL